MSKVQQLYDTILSADAFIVSDSPLLNDVDSSEITGNPENEVFYFRWTDGENYFSETITEADLENAIIEGNKLIFDDGDSLTLYSLNEVEINVDRTVYG